MSQINQTQGGNQTSGDQKTNNPNMTMIIAAFFQLVSE